jgi:hypothetical protein
VVIGGVLVCAPRGSIISLSDKQKFRCDDGRVAGVIPQDGDGSPQSQNHLPSLYLVGDDHLWLVHFFTIVSAP